MQSPTRLWFFRHGEVEPKYVGTFLGRTDAELSDLGRHQAQAMALFLEDAHMDVVLSSPRRRSSETGRPMAEAKELEIEVWDDFAEMDFGAWEGLAWDEIALRDKAYADQWQADPMAHPCPGGETAGAFATRVQESLSRLLTEFEGRSVALFAHAGVNRAILADLTGRPYMESFVFAQDYGCANAAAWDPATGFGQVALLNFVPGPRSFNQGDGRPKAAERSRPETEGPPRQPVGTPEG